MTGLPTVSPIRTEQFNPIEKQIWICAFSVSKMCWDFWSFWIHNFEFIKKRNNLFLHFLVVIHFILTINHKLMQEILQFYRFAQSNPFGIKSKFDVVLGEVVGQK